jgi:hypothetical protein
VSSKNLSHNMKIHSKRPLSLPFAFLFVRYVYLLLKIADFANTPTGWLLKLPGPSFHEHDRCVHVLSIDLVC